MGAVVLVTVVTALLTTESSPSHGELYVAVTAFLATGLAVIWHQVRRGRAFSALSGLTAYYLLAFPVGALFELTGAATKNSYTYQGLLWSVLLAFGGWIAMVLGYRFTPMAPRRAMTRTAERLFGGRTLSGARLLLLYGAGWIARADVYANGQYSRLNPQASTLGTSGFYVNSLALLPQFVIFYLLVTRKRKPGSPLIIAALLAEVGWALGSGARENFVALATGLAIALYIRNGRLPKKTVAVVVLISMFVVFPALDTYRNTKGTQQQALSQALSSVSLSPSYLQRGYQDTLGRVSTVVSSAAWFDAGRPAIAGWPTHTQLELLVTDLVPRVLLPSKPNSFQFGNSFGRAVGLLYATNYGTSVSISPPLQGYLLGGPVGVIVLMWLLGVFFRLFDSAFTAIRRLPVLGAVFCILAFQAYYSPETIVSADTYAIVKNLIFYSLIFLMVARRQGQAGEERPERAPLRAGRADQPLAAP